MRVLALDQASRTSGWAVFNDGKLVTFGKFTADHSDVGDRLHFIRSKVNSLIDEYDIDEVVFEDIQLQDVNGNKETGIKTFAKKMTEIQEKYGKESVAFISTGQMPTEDMALLGHVGRNHMGIPGDGNTRLCMATSVVGHKQSFGFDAPPYTLNDAELSKETISIAISQNAPPASFRTTGLLSQ